MATAAREVPVLARDEAFERLYRRYVKDVYHYALALLRNPADAEDVTQTTFLNAYRAIKRGEEPQKPQNWLIKIAHNAARTRYARSARRLKEVPLEDHIDALPVADDDKPDVAEVLQALGRLPLNQRAALVMRELEGRSYAEIADTLGVSVPAVETLIFRARRALRLNASAVRVLSVVQLPPSLAQFVDGRASCSRPPWRSWPALSPRVSPVGSALSGPRPRRKSLPSPRRRGRASARSRARSPCPPIRRLAGSPSSAT